MGRQIFIREDREEAGLGGGKMQSQQFERPRQFVPPHHVIQYQQQHAPSVPVGEGRKIYVGNLSWEVKIFARDVI